MPGNLRAICGIQIVTGQPSDDENSEDTQEKFKELTARLKYLDEKTKGYIEQMNEALKALDKEEKQKKATVQIALKTTLNIRELVQALLLTKPIFLSGQRVRLSWQGEPAKRKEVEATTKSTETTTTTTDTKPAKKSRPEFQQPYRPPKNPTSTTTTTSSPRGRGRGGRGFRGRGRGGRW